MKWYALLVCALTLTLLPYPAASTAQTATNPNGYLAFSAETEGRVSLYLINPAGGQQHPLTYGPDDAAPAWSPDGLQLVYRGVQNGTADLVVVNADGSNPRQLTDDPARDSSPAWSPDGTRLAFASDREGNLDLYVMQADGANPQRLTTSPHSEDSPSWSPDGTRLAYVSMVDGNAEIYVMQADGANPQRLTDNAAVDDSPSWSPDGSALLFRSERDGTSSLYVMQADGTDPRPLLTPTTPAYSPTWSPDGQWVAYVLETAAGYALHVVKADGSDDRTLASTMGSSYGLAWQPIPPQVISSTVEVTAQAWQREWVIEQYVDFNIAGWQSTPPLGDNLMMVGCEERQRGTRQVPDGQNCRTESSGGVSQTTCTTIYREQPVYDTACTFMGQRWEATRRIVTSGSGLDPAPTWGELDLKCPDQAVEGCERLAYGMETYTLTLSHAAGQAVTCALPQAEWEGVGIGSVWSVQVSATGAVYCASLTPAP